MDTQRRGPIGHAFGEQFTLAAKYDDAGFEQENSRAGRRYKLDWVTAHEFGHVIDGIIRDAHGKEGEKNVGYDKAIRKIKADHKNAGADSTLVSIYSMKDNGEYVAEHFADAIMNGNQAHPYSKKVYQAMKEWYGKNKYKGLSEAYQGFQRDKEEERAKAAARLASMVQPREHPGNGSIVEDANGKEYLVVMARNSIVNVAPITNGKAEVNRDSIISFNTDRDFQPASDSTRYAKLFKTGRNYYEEQGQQAPTSMPETISIGGKDRSTKNSKGEYIHATEEGIRNFWKWFGNSTVVDAQGKPLLVYHYTQHDFTEFKEQGNGRGKAFWFTASEREGSPHGGKRIAAYLKIEKPLDTDDQYTVEEGSWDDDIMNGIRRKKQDGITYFDKHNPDVSNPGSQRKKGETHKVTRDESQFVVFDSGQIKSTGNAGSFDGSNKNITKSLSLTHLLVKSNQNHGYHGQFASAPSANLAQRKFPVEPFDASLLLPEIDKDKKDDKEEQKRHINLFMAEFGGSVDKPVWFKDATNRKIRISARMFKDRQTGKYKIFKNGRERYLLMLAAALKNPTEIWEDTRVKNGKTVSVRKYVATYRIGNEKMSGLIVFDLINGNWEGTSAHQRANINSARTGTQIYSALKKADCFAPYKWARYPDSAKRMPGRTISLPATISPPARESNKSLAGGYLLKSARLAGRGTARDFDTRVTVKAEPASTSGSKTIFLRDNRATTLASARTRHHQINLGGPTIVISRRSHNNLQTQNRPSAHIKPAPQNDIRHLPALLKAARTLHGRIDFNGLQVSIETGRSRSRTPCNTSR
ncbi:MAG: PBECR2 nuclease fold domain-containing protein [Desulfuromonadaceae bacterium]|nr:PBECR2 nuclease fold domain-containing protein [Desulfuromonadaceae bacterium]